MSPEHLYFDLPFLAVLRHTYLQTFNTGDAFDIDPSSFRAFVQATRHLFRSEYGEELKIPNMSPIVNAEAFALHASARGNLQTLRLLSALGLQPCRPFIGEMDTGFQVAMKPFYESNELALMEATTCAGGTNEGDAANDPNELDI